MKKIELLAPAGNMESLKAAVRGGADAIYLGGRSFGARAFAGNFNNEEIQEAIDYCHLRNVKVYITVNTLIADEELSDFIEYVGFLYKIGGDALIVQDIGSITLIKKYFPEMEIHASTQMTNNTSDDIIFLKNLGVKRVVISREIPYTQIKAIQEKTQIEMEAFVHGALCISYSGKCLFSAMNGGRSANRGMCAQPCRMKYEYIGLEEPTGEYLLSPKDLNTILEIDKIIESNIHSLKIEGRMKRPEYVFLVTNHYRKAIDSYIKKESLDKKDMYKDLYKVFNRDFTSGYILGDNGTEIINSNYQKPIGTKLGEVISYNKKTKKLKLKLLDDLHKGDGLSTGEFVGRVLKNNEVLTKGFKGDVIELDSLKKYIPGEIIYKTSDFLFMEDLNSKISLEKKVPIDVKVEIRLNEKPKIVIRDYNERQLEKEMDLIVEKARNKPLDEFTVTTQISKTGNSPFYIEKISVILDRDINLPIKSLNSLRREAISEFENLIINSYKRISSNTINYVENNFSNENIQKKNIAKTKIVSKSKLSVKITKNEHLDFLENINVSRIYISDRKIYDLAIENDKFKDKIWFSMPSVITEKNHKYINDLMNSLESNIMFSSNGMITKMKEKNSIGDYHLNLYNSISHNYFHDLGIRTTASLEQIYGNEFSIPENVDKTMMEIPIYIRPQLMITEYCPFKNSEGKCKKNKCEIENVNLKNEKNELFYFKNIINCRLSISSQNPKSLDIKHFRNLVKMGYESFRIELFNESRNEFLEILSYYGFDIKTS